MGNVCWLRRASLALLPLLSLLAAACEGDSGDEGGPGPAPPPTTARCETPQPVACIDQATAALRLLVKVNEAPVTNTPLGGGVFESRLDASGGGMTPTLSFNYVRFTAQGLEKVAIGDDAAFTSMDWDLGFRRYIIRANGGASGPSCVDAAQSDRPFDALTAVPEALGYETDLFLEAPACALASDGNGFGPLTAIAEYYSYQGCLIMNGQAFIVRLRDGRHVALEVLGYYSDAVQAHCNQTGMLPAGMSNAGSFRLRWKFLPPPA